IPQALSAWRVAAHFLVSFIIGVLGAEVLASWLVKHTEFDGAPVDALCAVLVSVLSVKVLSFVHGQDVISLMSCLLSRLKSGGGDNVK
ncbi:TPA: holin, partial [Escherichia coli]|nr:holin [Escherichia coli]